jgi:3-methyladenine DNA glycosylase/8-oxoguanine DNA glycosylase
MGDPTLRITGPSDIWRATRTPDGPASFHLWLEGADLVAEAWGRGASWALEHAPGFVGALDNDRGFSPADPFLSDLWRRFRGVRITCSARIIEALIPVILEQKVTGIESRRAWRKLVLAMAEPAPGPRSDLVLPPDPGAVADLAYFEFHPFGVERRRAELLVRVCRDAKWFEELTDLPTTEAESALGSIPGIGPWTVAEVSRIALGDADAVSIGDFHLPNIVCWALAGEPRGTDERMLELLAPYRGNRGRVQRLLEVSGIRARARGPRMEPRMIEDI